MPSSSIVEAEAVDGNPAPYDDRCSGNACGCYVGERLADIVRGIRRHTSRVSWSAENEVLAENRVPWLPVV